MYKRKRGRGGRLTVRTAKANNVVDDKVTQVGWHCRLRSLVAVADVEEMLQVFLHVLIVGGVHDSDGHIVDKNGLCLRGVGDGKGGGGGCG